MCSKTNKPSFSVHLYLGHQSLTRIKFKTGLKKSLRPVLMRFIMLRSKIIQRQLRFCFRMVQMFINKINKALMSFTWPPSRMLCTRSHSFSVTVHFQLRLEIKVLAHLSTGLHRAYLMKLFATWYLWALMLTRLTIEDTLRFILWLKMQFLTPLLPLILLSNWLKQGLTPRFRINLSWFRSNTLNW